MQQSTAACSTEELSEHCKKVDARHEHSHDIQTCQVKIKQLHKNEDKQKLFWISTKAMHSSFTFVIQMYKFTINKRE